MVRNMPRQMSEIMASPWRMLCQWNWPSLRRLRDSIHCPRVLRSTMPPIRQPTNIGSCSPASWNSGVITPPSISAMFSHSQARSTP